MRARRPALYCRTGRSTAVVYRRGVPRQASVAVGSAGRPCTVRGVLASPFHLPPFVPMENTEIAKTCVMPAGAVRRPSAGTLSVSPVVFSLLLRHKTPKGLTS